MNLIPNVAIVVVADDDGNTIQQVLTSDKMSFEEGITTSGDLNVNVSGTGSYTLNVGGQEVLRASPNSILTLNSDLFINANLVVQGTTTALDVQNVTIKDNIILLSSGTVGAPILDAGIEIDRGVETNSQFLWDETNDYWIAGIAGNLKQIVDVDYLDLSLGDYLPISGGSLTGFLTLHADPTASGHAATKQYVDALEAEDISITVTGSNFVEAGISGTNVQDAISDVVDAVNTTDSRRAVNYVFTTGQAGSVIPYAETRSTSYSVVSQFIFPGTDFLAEPSLAQVIMSAQEGRTGTIRIYDITNAIEIAVVSSSTSIMTITDLVITGSWPSSEAILEVQSKISQNNRWTRVATLSLRWN